jgi:hypothetical protein
LRIASPHILARHITVTLGAKHIVSSTMKSTDVMELNRQNIDIKEKMTLDVQASVGETAKAKLPDPPDESDGDDSNVIKVYDCRGKQPPAAIDPPAAEPATPAVPKSKGKGSLFGASVGFSLETETSTSSETESVSKIKEKVKTVTELTIGGYPPEDGNWKTWAASVRARPIPVVLELEGIWDYMTEDQAKSFMDAILFRYGLDLSDRSTSEILQAMHFGIYEPDGLPISSYSTSSNHNYRCLFAVTELKPNIIEAEPKYLIDDANRGLWTGKETSCPTGF